MEKETGTPKTVRSPGVRVVVNLPCNYQSVGHPPSRGQEL